MAEAPKVIGTSGVAREFWAGAFTMIVGVPKAAVIVTGAETLVLPRSSLAIASRTKDPVVVGLNDAT